MALAQEGQFLTAMPLTEANFTQPEQSRWQYLSQGTDAMSIQLVRVGDLSSFIEDGKLAFSIPGEWPLPASIASGWYKVSLTGENWSGAQQIIVNR